MNFDDIFKGDESYPYRLLSRMKSDCEYYFGYGNRCAKHLWAGNEKDQIAYMKAIWNRLSEKPEWLSFEQILEYEKKMISKEQQVTPQLKPSLSSQIHCAEEKAFCNPSTSEINSKDHEPQL